jgi:hypothetical protein
MLVGYWAPGFGVNKYGLSENGCNGFALHSASACISIICGVEGMREQLNLAEYQPLQ